MNKRGFQIFAAKEDAEIYVYGGINVADNAGYIVDSGEFADAVHGLDAKKITVRIASVGGDPVGAGAMYQALVDHPAQVTTVVDSRAYSAGSMILQAGDRRVARPLAMVMVHGPSMGIVGSAKDHMEAASALNAHAEMMVSAYTRHGLDESTVRGWIASNQDHYFSAKEALAAKLIDEIAESVQLAASAPEDYRIAAMGGDASPAESSAQPQQQEPVMAEKTEAVTQAADTDILAKHSRTVKQATQAGVKAEASRRTSIAAVFDDFYDADPLNPISALHDECMDDVNCDELTARRKLLAFLANKTEQPIVAREHYGMEQSPAAPPRASSYLGGAMLQGRDQIEKRNEGLTKALQIKAGLITDRRVIDDERKGQFLAMSMVDIMAQELRAAGLPANGLPDDIVRSYLRHEMILAAGPSHGTDHLPAVLGNIANLSAMQGWESSEETWSQWTQQGTLSNYQTHTRANVALLDKLTRMMENQEWEYGDMADVKQRITGYFYGLKYSLSIQAIRNDDLGELSRTMQGWGEAASATVGDVVYALLTTAGSGGVGQVMDEDSKVLFHADHANYVASSGGITEATLNTARKAMVSQNDPNGRKVAVRPRYVIHGPGLYSTVYKLLNSQLVVTGESATIPDANAVRAMGLTPVEEYRITSNNWFLAAARRTVEVAGVGGPLSPRAEQSPVSNVPGLTYELSMPFGAAALDYRGMYYSVA